MTPQDFVHKWQAGSPAHALGERAGARAHFIDLCHVLGVSEPADPERYCFERGLIKTGSLAARTDGFADVWLKGCFAWEYRAPGKSLEGALRQLMMYALPLESPPLLVVSDRLRMEVHTHFTGTPSVCHAFTLADISQPEVRERLRTLWTEPERWRPRTTNRDITEQAARTFAGMAERLRAADVAPQRVSHFLTQCVSPPIEFAALLAAADLPQDFRDAVADLLARKQAAGEMADTPPVPALQRFIETELARDVDLRLALNGLCADDTWQALDGLFVEVLGERLCA